MNPFSLYPCKCDEPKSWRKWQASCTQALGRPVYGLGFVAGRCSHEANYFATGLAGRLTAYGRAYPHAKIIIVHEVKVTVNSRLEALSKEVHL